MGGGRVRRAMQEEAFGSSRSIPVRFGFEQGKKRVNDGGRDDRVQEKRAFIRPISC